MQPYTLWSIHSTCHAYSCNTIMLHAKVQTPKESPRTKFCKNRWMSDFSWNAEKHLVLHILGNADRCLTHVIHLNSCSSATYEVTSWTKRMEKTTSTINKTWQQHVVPNSIPRREKSKAACLHAGTNQTCHIDSNRVITYLQKSWRVCICTIYNSICEICWIISNWLKLYHILSPVNVGQGLR